MRLTAGKLAGRNKRHGTITREEGLVKSAVIAVAAKEKNNSSLANGRLKTSLAPE